MMSLRSWFALLVFYVLYLLMGGYIFNAIECPGEIVEKEREATERRDLWKLVSELEGDWSLRRSVMSQVLDFICATLMQTSFRMSWHRILPP